MNDSCEMRSLVERHFEGKVRPEEEKELRSHLSSCSSCRMHYENLMLRSKIDPKSMDAQSRIAIGLGILPRRKSVVGPVLALSAALAAALLLIVFLPGTPRQGEGFAARGHDGNQANLLIYRFQQGKTPTLVVDEITRSDELAFAYENHTGKKRLLVFGIDEDKNIYWYHPAWTWESDNPVAVSIQSGDAIHELPEAVTHQIQGRSLRIYAIFTDEPISVRQMEEMLRNRELSEGKLVKNAFQTSIFLKVRR
jgi:hypothetical protein